MKKWFALSVILLVVLGLVGCTVGITLVISPDPIVFNSGDDIANATVTVTTSGMGSLTINSITATLYEAANSENVLYSYDTDDNTEFPMAIPFVVDGFSKTFELKEYIGEKTITEIINENGAAIGVSTYADLVGKQYKLKVEVTTDTITSTEASVNFN